MSIFCVWEPRRWHCFCAAPVNSREGALINRIAKHSTSQHFFWAGELNIRHTFTKTICVEAEEPHEYVNMLLCHLDPMLWQVENSECSPWDAGGGGAIMHSTEISNFWEAGPPLYPRILDEPELVGKIWAHQHIPQYLLYIDQLFVGKNPFIFNHNRQRPERSHDENRSFSWRRIPVLMTSPASLSPNLAVSSAQRIFVRLQNGKAPNQSKMAVFLFWPNSYKKWVKYAIIVRKPERIPRHAVTCAWLRFKVGGDLCMIVHSN